MSETDKIMFADGIYTSISHIFTGLQCGIIFSYIFQIGKKDLDKMSRIELYVRIIFELFLMSVIIYWYTPVFNYFGLPFDGMHDYKRKDNPKINSNVLFAIAFLVGNKSLENKVTAIINKSGMITIPKADSK